MRQIDTHLNGGFNTLQITVMDNTPPGFPPCRYDITGFNTVYNAAADDPTGYPAHFTRLPVIFQNGPLLSDVPQNGISENALLAITADHLQCKQAGPNACVEYQMALDYIQAALRILNSKPEIPFTSQQAFASIAA